MKDDSGVRPTTKKEELQRTEEGIEKHAETRTRMNT
jgi:hypothetical protein